MHHLLRPPPTQTTLSRPHTHSPPERPDSRSPNKSGDGPGGNRRRPDDDGPLAAQRDSDGGGGSSGVTNDETRVRSRPMTNAGEAQAKPDEELYGRPDRDPVPRWAV
jgi:hypothetical protein